MKLHQKLYSYASRPAWAGGVQIASRQRLAAPGQVAHSVEVSGLVLPVSVPKQSFSGAGSHTFGLGLGFPHLGEQLPDVNPDLWKSWGRLEQVVAEAAANAMAWKGPQRPHQAAHTGAPENAIHLRIFRNTLESTRPEDAGKLLRPDTVSGKISKVFAIRDVSGSRLRYESAGAAANFTLTPSSAHWSRDPRTL